MAKQAGRTTKAARARNERRASLYALPTYRKLLRRLALNVRRLRADREWTQEDAAHAAKMSVRQWQHVENGTANLSLISIARVLDGLGVDAEQLFRAR